MPDFSYHPTSWPYWYNPGDDFVKHIHTSISKLERERGRGDADEEDMVFGLSLLIYLTAYQLLKGLFDSKIWFICECLIVIIIKFLIFLCNSKKWQSVEAISYNVLDCDHVENEFGLEWNCCVPFQTSSQVKSMDFLIPPPTMN